MNKKKNRYINFLICFFILLFFIFIQKITASENKFIDKFEILFFPEKIYEGQYFIAAAKIKINDKYHINSDKPLSDYLIPTVLEINGKYIEQAEIKYPDPEKIKLSYSSSEISVFKSEIYIYAKIKFERKIIDEIIELKLKFGFQPCDDFSCYPPSSIEKSAKLQTEKNTKIQNKFFPGWFKKINFDPEKIFVFQEYSADSAKNKLNESLETISDKFKKEIVDAAGDSNSSAVTENKISASPDLKEKVSGGFEHDKILPPTHKSIFVYLFFAFIGGIILNVMPCVLPVLSIKLLGLIKQSDYSRKNLVISNLYFISGIFFTFLIISVIVIIIKQSGGYVGWGFQFQNAGFIIFISTILLIVSLNLYGVFEVTVPSFEKIQNIKTKVSDFKFSKFLEGILATLLATPCTAPFLGISLGFAFSQGPVIILLIFFFISLGMSIPYIAIIIFPSFIKLLPKPGNWMIILKQFLGFPVILTVIWMLWILNSLAGTDVLFNVIIFYTIISFCCWVFGKITYIKQSFKYTIIIILLFLSVLSGKKLLFNNNVVTKSFLTENEIQKYSEEIFYSALKTDRIVFLEFTADWCLTCQFNKKNVLESKKILELFSEKRVLHIRADWTTGDKNITLLLNKFNRSGVPLYVIYPSDKTKPFYIMPEIITIKMLEELIQ
ncbi:thioredoxin family protein [Candidatus Dependentiae bacterium]|nr:thioredoxin family protein [Candidatus Dependentiae bacterium]